MNRIALLLVVLLPLMGCSSARRPVIVTADDASALLASSVLVDDWVKIHLKDGSIYKGRVAAMDTEAITIQNAETGSRRLLASSRCLAWTDIESMEVKDQPGGAAKTAEFLLGLSLGAITSFYWLLYQIFGGMS